MSYLPLPPGRTLEYRPLVDSGDEAGSSRKLEVLDAQTAGGRTRTRCRWTFCGADGKDSSWETTVTEDAGWMTCDGSFLELPVAKLFPIAPALGATWDEVRWTFEVTDLHAEVYVGDDAGVPMIIKDCLEVSWHFDEGSGAFYYDKRLGLVKAESTDEQYPFAFVIEYPQRQP
jgi:hypothetical protein